MGDGVGECKRDAPGAAEDDLERDASASSGESFLSLLRNAIVTKLAPARAGGRCQA